MFSWCLLISLTTVTSYAQQLTRVEANGLTYITLNGKAILYMIADSIEGELVIPESVEGCQVVAVGCKDARRSYSPLASRNFTSVTFPNSIVDENVTMMSFSARYGMEYATVRDCKNLKEVKVPDHITRLPGNMYRDRSSLEHIELPVSLKYFSSPDFSGCNSLKSMKWPAGVTDVGGFANCTALEEVLIPEGVLKVNEDAFYGCENLDITLPESIQIIEDKAFSGCRKLKLDHLPSSLTYLGREAFYSCPLLTVNSIPTGVKVVNTAFIECDNITSMHLHKDVTEASGLGGKNLATITVDAANPFLKTIDGVLFNATGDTLFCCPGARTGSYVAPESTRSILRAAFADSQLNEVELPDGVATLQDDVFFHAAVRKVTLSSNVVFNKANTQECTVFADADSIESIKVRPGDGKYYDIDGVLCKQEDGHETMVFYPYNRPDEEYILPAKIDSIGMYISANKLKKFTWGEGLKRLNKATLLRDCKQLQTVVLPNTIEDINGNLCLNCPALRNVVSYMEREEQFKQMSGRNYYQFTNVDKTLCTVYCPDGLVEMYENSGVWRVLSEDFESNGPLTIRPMSEYLPTGIEETAAQPHTQDGNEWYTIDGRRTVKPNTKGIYIHNGRKILMK